MDIYGLALLAGLLLFGVVLMIVLFEEVGKQRRRGGVGQRAKHSPISKGPPQWSVRRIEELTHNRKTAERLLMACWANNRERNWYWVTDRVTTDLLRDRGYTGVMPPLPVEQRPSRNTSQGQNIPPWAAWIAVSVLLVSVYGHTGGSLSFFNTLTSISTSTNEGTGHGEVSPENLANFPPPSQYQQIGGNEALLTLNNGSPDELSMVLKLADGSRVTLKFPPCRECRPYSRDESPPCGTVGSWVSYQIPTGNYEVIGSFFGAQRTTGFKSAWAIAPGWEYRSCVYTLDEPHYL